MVRALALRGLPVQQKGVILMTREISHSGRHACGRVGVRKEDGEVGVDRGRIRPEVHDTVCAAPSDVVVRKQLAERGVLRFPTDQKDHRGVLLIWVRHLLDDVARSIRIVKIGLLLS